MTTKEIHRLVSSAAPTCGANDSEGRYRVWLDNPTRVIKARTKEELRKKLKHQRKAAGEPNHRTTPIP